MVSNKKYSYIFVIFCFLILHLSGYAGISSDSCSSKGLVQYKPNGNCLTQSRTCCGSGYFSVWDTDCPAKDSCAPGDLFDESTGRCYQWDVSYGQWQNLTVPNGIEKWNESIGSQACATFSGNKDYRCSTEEKSNCLTYQSFKSSTMSWTPIFGPTSSMPTDEDTCDGNKNAKYSSSACKECMDVYVALPRGTYKPMKKTVKDTSNITRACYNYGASAGGYTAERSPEEITSSYANPVQSSRLCDDHCPADSTCLFYTDGEARYLGSRWNGYAIEYSWECIAHVISCSVGTGESFGGYKRQSSCNGYQSRIVNCSKKYTT